jgi:hypothetical protein
LRNQGSGEVRGVHYQAPQRRCSKVTQLNET